MKVVLDEKNPVLRDMYSAAHRAMKHPASFKRLEAQARGIFVKMQGHEATQIGSYITLRRMITLVGWDALPAVALGERMDLFRLQPCLSQFRVVRPFWFGLDIPEGADGPAIMRSMTASGGDFDATCMAIAIALDVIEALPRRH